MVLEPTGLFEAVTFSTCDVKLTSRAEIIINSAETLEYETNMKLGHI